MASIIGATNVFFSAIPCVLSFVIILIIGWFIATLIGKAIRALLHAVNFNALATKAGLDQFIQKTGMQTDASGFLADIVKMVYRPDCSGSGI